MFSFLASYLSRISVYCYWSDGTAFRLTRRRRRKGISVLVMFFKREMVSHVYDAGHWYSSCYLDVYFCFMRFLALYSRVAEGAQIMA